MKPRGYEEIKALAKHLRMRIPEMLALAQNNDPFYAGSEASRQQAEWFAAVWRTYGYTVGVHIRRVHYRLVVDGTATNYDGTAYDNTEACWDDLNKASRAARYLELVDPLAFVDRRNPAPHLFASGPATVAAPTVAIEAPFFSLPSINADLADDVWLNLPTASVMGYDYAGTDQPYHLELWIEKTTMDDVLIPVCQTYAINLQTGAGFQSVTNVIKMLQRMADAEKPARIFYISDFDPAGDGMPIQVARQVEYWLDAYAPERDIKLIPLALTLAQAQHYRLPRVPMKETNPQKAGFEQRYGVGAVELDALEALHPGALARLVVDAAAPYRDLRLPAKLARTAVAARRTTEQAWANATVDQADQLATIERDAIEIAERYRGRLAALRDEMATAMAPLEARLESVRLAIQDAADAFAVDLPARPEPETTPGDESDWLFDSQRDYLQQLTVYRGRRGKAGAV